MKATLDFDPRTIAQPSSVRALLVAWSEIDWFEPADTSDVDAEVLFRAHQRLAHAHAPADFPLAVDVRGVRDTRAGFEAWCAQVRRNTEHDWKLGTLKQLSRAHTQAKGWTPPPIAPQDLVPGTLHFSYRDTVIWIGAPVKLPDPSEGTRFYVDYAHGDLLDAIQWQLAEGHDDLDGNPFWPLLQLYGLGVYPFSLGRAAVALFRFG